MAQLYRGHRMLSNELDMNRLNFGYRRHAMTRTRCQPQASSDAVMHTMGTTRFRDEVALTATQPRVRSNRYRPEEV